MRETGAVRLLLVNPIPLKESPAGHWRVLLPLWLALTIYVVSSRPIPDEFRAMIAMSDKLVHFAVYGMMALLIARLRLVQERLPGGAMAAIVLVALFGLADELHQISTPGRIGDFADWVADVLGALTFVTAYVHWPPCRRWLEHRVVVREGSRLRIDLPEMSASGLS